MLIGGGDLNQRLKLQLDSSGRVQPKNTIARKIRKVMSQLGILDIWKELNPFKRNYTHFSAPHSVYSRIYYFLVYTGDRYRILNCNIGVMDLSDHCPIY